MNARNGFDVPTELEMVAWFGCEPVRLGEGQYRYQVSDRSNVILVFSFDVIESSIQTVLIVADTPAMRVVQESASKLWLQDLGDGKRLRAECFLGGHRTELTIEIEPRIKVEWSTLRE